MAYQEKLATGSGSLEEFVSKLEQQLQKNVATGEFGADMKVRLINDGPVTIWIDSKARE